MIEILPILNGIGSGVMIGLTGWFKSGEEFDWIKILTTISVGATCGLVFSLSGTNIEMTMQLMTSAGIIVIVENLFKAIKKKYFSPKK